MIPKRGRIYQTPKHHIIIYQFFISHSIIIVSKKMANNEKNELREKDGSCSFMDFPDDVLVCILSFLGPTEIATFGCTSKRFVSLCGSDSRVWFSMCERRWGSKTSIAKWGKGKISYRILYNTLHDWENLLGFWRRSGDGTPSLLFFEWGPSFLAASRVSPSKSGAYDVTKAPFLWMTLSQEGHVVCFLDPHGRVDFSPNVDLGFSEVQALLVPVSVSFMGKTHVVVEESAFRRSSSSVNLCGGEDCGGEDGVGGGESGSPGSLPDRLMSEIYQHFANRTSPGSDKSRRQRRREKERLARRKWETQHFVKIVNCSPTPSRPLQGLWKGICDDMSLAFYLVAYDDIGGIACRRIGDHPEHFSSYGPVFWTSDTTFLESPFSLEEESLYDSRIHLRPLQPPDNDIHEQFSLSDDEVVDRIQQFHLSDNEVVNRILHISSSYDLFSPELAGTINPRSAEGRIWQYQNGTFGFGFLRDNFVIDMKHIVDNGCLVDTVNTSAD
ncbi:F-box protein At3g12350 isoform X2 [Abrus precatorius]|uniref:F-box protein n=1 Tax=Abrus precatorius TaxID=3816 RepID=A0A8B8JMI3_ABRPR|nr:F-box protein At3g12350 isoform X2 [Abrus precatorius]